MSIAITPEERRWNRWIAKLQGAYDELAADIIHIEECILPFRPGRDTTQERVRYRWLRKCSEVALAKWRALYSARAERTFEMLREADHG
jgi:hypothetical protein